MSRGAKWLLGGALVLCWAQVPRSVDFSDYYLRGKAVWGSGFRSLPYPVGHALFGDFFQSPLVVIFLGPFTALPLAAAKVLWAAMNTAGLIYLFRRTIRRNLTTKEAFFLLLVFAHPVSDVFLSGNINFPLLALILLGWDQIHSESKGGLLLGGVALALAVLIKLQPVLFPIWFLARGQGRRAAAVAGGIVFWLALSALLLPADLYGAWWKGWLHAVSLYSQSAQAGSLSYQSPPAVLFRWLSDFSPLDPRTRWTVVSGFAVALQGLLFTAAWLGARDRVDGGRVAFPLLLSTFFLGGPFSWALTVLFLFPLIVEAIRDGVPAGAWAAALVLAALPKALWPEPQWNWIAQRGLPALCLATLGALAAHRLLRPQRLTAQPAS